MAPKALAAESAGRHCTVARQETAEIDQPVSCPAALSSSKHPKVTYIAKTMKQAAHAQFLSHLSPGPDVMMQVKSLKRIYQKNDHVPLLKLILFSVVALAIIVLAAVLTYQLTASLNWTFFVGGLLIMLALVGSILTLS